jgi:hypothetical protein
MKKDHTQSLNYTPHQKRIKSSLCILREDLNKLERKLVLT